MAVAEAIREPQTGMFDKQLVFFYELCEAGVVSFDKSNKEHIKLLVKMCQMMSADSDSEDALSPLGYLRGLTYAAILRKVSNNNLSGKVGA